MYTIKFAFKSGRNFEVNDCTMVEIEKVLASKQGERIVLNCGIIETSQIEFVSWSVK